VADLVRSQGFSIVNVDSTLLLERPKILPHVPLMRERIAEALSIPVPRVSVKATTNEGMGFVGRNEGAVAHAVACLGEHAPPA
jgi:2-C-methyl-D-erythritol 2,4-cyclodiphosphate synthase